MTGPATSFSQQVAAALERRFPRRFASDDDNIGLTVGTLHDVKRGSMSVLVLCVDLTEQVLAEAIASRADQVITYSPTPSQPLRTLTPHDPIGRILLGCAQHNIAVHSIHTACANAPHGVATWLAQSIACGSTRPIIAHSDCAEAGEGRLLECDDATPLSTILARLKELLAVQHLRLALGAVVDEHNLAKANEGCFVKSIAIQIGEGSDLLHRLSDSFSGVFITSEMSHADILAANAKGIIVLLTGQSTIERAYLQHLRLELQDEFVDADWNVKVKCSQVGCHSVAIV